MRYVHITSPPPLCIKLVKKPKHPSFPALWAAYDLTNRVSILPRFYEFRVKVGLSSPPHIDQHRLTKMPTQKLIRREKCVVEEFLIYIKTSGTTTISEDIRCEADNFIIILHNYQLRIFNDLEFPTSGLIDTS